MVFHSPSLFSRPFEGIDASRIEGGNVATLKVPTKPLAALRLPDALLERLLDERWG